MADFGSDPLPPPTQPSHEKSKKRGRPPKDDRDALKRRAMERTHRSFDPLPADSSGPPVPSTKDDARAAAENENANHLKLKQDALQSIELFEAWFPDKIGKKCGLTLDDPLERLEEQVKDYKAAVTLHTCDERVILGLSTAANTIEQITSVMDPKGNYMDLTGYGKTTYETMTSAEGRMTVRMAIVSNSFMRINNNPLLDLGLLMVKTAAEVREANRINKGKEALMEEMKEKKKRTAKPADVPAFRSTREAIKAPPQSIEEIPAPAATPSEPQRTTPE